MSNDNKLNLIKAILYASDCITSDEKFNAICHLIHGWDKESNTEPQPSWLNDLSIETRDMINGLSNN